MKIIVTYDACRKDGSTGYALRTESEGKDSAQSDRLVELLPRIEAMARRQFGEDFISLLPMHCVPYALDLRVKTGTTKNNRFDKLAFFGWVELFDDEP